MTFGSEPPVDPLADTNPSVTIRPEEFNKDTLPAWRRMMGFISLIGAAVLTIVTIAIFLAPNNPAPDVSNEVSLTAIPTDIPLTPTPTIDGQATTLPTQVAIGGALPTIVPGSLLTLLTTPAAAVEQAAAFSADERSRYDPFTFVPDRPRNQMEQYTVVRGDTISGIAARFGLQQESVAWSNDRRIIWTLRPGDVLYIPPVDGVYLFQGTTGSSRTLTDYIAIYQVTDPFTVLDSEYNPQLAGMNPDTVPPSGTHFFIPGGIGEQIAWTPPITEEQATIGGVTGNFVTFAPGEPGSCAPTLRGSGTVWVNPLPGGTWMRGFSSWHTGVDLAAPEGTSVAAANGGNVIFAGWSNWGYGNAIVISHGPILTLYGHLSAIYVGCGQNVSAGQSIGAVGTTGNSSGPHLHFEVRSGDTPTDPSSIFSF
jgi:murein DD-endopeptidase MepM/ murein hydrolase activator NlpD